MKNQWIWVAMFGLLLVPVGALFVLPRIGSNPEGGAGEGGHEPTVSGQGASGRNAAPPTSAQANAAGGSLVARARQIGRSDPAESRRLLEEALTQDPDNELALELIAVKHLADERHPDARRRALRCLDINPKNARCAGVKKHVLSPSDKSAQTAQFLGNCLERNPTNKACLSGRMLDHLRHGEPEQAAPFAERLLEAHPESTMARLAEARMHGVKRDYGSSLSVFETLCEGGTQFACYRAEKLREEGW